MILKLRNRNFNENQAVGGQECKICGNVEAIGFSVQNTYKMACGDENTTSESRCKREIFEPLNSYGF